MSCKYKKMGNHKIFLPDAALSYMYLNTPKRNNQVIFCMYSLKTKQRLQPFSN